MKKWFIFYLTFYMFTIYYLMPYFKLYILLVVTYIFISFGLAINTSHIIACTKKIESNDIKTFILKVFIIITISITAIFFMFLQAFIVDLIQYDLFFGHPIKH